ncbi:alpha/beta hydrolase [Nonomuraea sp. NN258]|uniref:alpha/beta hydrolase n=1 Tax=Nonomuraea antri TaxID=2730852 RepID=UPI0015692F3A|nr:alpha/beta hydrolase [Nonomuraea antri]NRQ33113.1 alpha/beta hydrolase [Nonomuraea antri]
MTEAFLPAVPPREHVEQVLALHEADPAMPAEMRRAHRLLADMHPGTTPDDGRDPREQRRDEYVRWAERFPVPGDVTITPWTGGDGLSGLQVIPETHDQERVVLYLHGGGFFEGGSANHREWGAKLAVQAQARVILLDYPRAPERPFPAAPHAVLDAYRALLRQGARPGKIAVGGDSAGGYLTLRLLTDLRAKGLPLPAAGVTISGVFDLTLSSASLWNRRHRDPFIVREGLEGAIADFLQGADPAAPAVSPLFADLTALPPLLIEVGTEEVVHDDSIRLYGAAKRAGADATLVITEGAPHIWQHFTSFLPQARESMARIGEFIRKHTD